MARPAPALDAAAERPRASALVWVVALLSVAAALSPRDLWSPDEPRYGRVAREMIASGDWLVPHVNGKPYAEKPPLVYWGMAAVGKVSGGLGPAGARIPGAIFAAIAVLATARLARRWFGDPDLGDTAAVLFGPMLLVLWNGSRAALDLPLTACTLLAVEGGTVLIARRSLRGALGFGAALGAGVLTKGPHAFFVPIAAFVGGCVGARAKRRLLDWRWLVGLAVAAAVVLAWLLPALEAGGADYEKRLIGQIGSRLEGDDEPHSQGPFYLLPLLLAFSLPWTPYWVVGAVEGARALFGRGRRGRAPAADAAPADGGTDRFGLGAALGAVAIPLVALSIPGSKRELYLIPLLPHAAILGAWAIHRGIAPRALALAVRGPVLHHAQIGAGAFLVPRVAPSLRPQSGADDRVSGRTLAQGGVPFALGAVGVLCLCGAGAARLLAGRTEAVVRSAAVALGAAWVVAATAILPVFDPAKSMREAAAVALAQGPGVPLHIAGFSDTSMLWAFDPSGTRTVRQVTGPEQLARTLAPDAPKALVFAKAKHWEQAVDWAVEHHHEWTLPTLRSVVLLWRGRLGNTVFTLHTNAR